MRQIQFPEVFLDKISKLELSRLELNRLFPEYCHAISLN